MILKHLKYAKVGVYSVKLCYILKIAHLSFNKLRLQKRF